MSFYDTCLSNYDASPNSLNPIYYQTNLVDNDIDTFKDMLAQPDKNNSLGSNCSIATALWLEKNKVCTVLQDIRAIYCRLSIVKFSSTYLYVLYQNF